MITIHDIQQALSCRCITGETDGNRPVKGGYAGDMLSWVMAHVNQDDIWLTILNSINVVAVAELSECACVLLTESVTMDPAVLGRAAERNVVVLQTDLTTFAASAAIHALLDRQ